MVAKFSSPKFIWDILYRFSKKSGPEFFSLGRDQRERGNIGWGHQPTMGIFRLKEVVNAWVK